MLLVAGVEVAIVELNEVLVALVEVADSVAGLRLVVPRLAVGRVGRSLEQLRLRDGLAALVYPLHCLRVDHGHVIEVAPEQVAVGVVAAEYALEVTVVVILRDKVEVTAVMAVEGPITVGALTRGAAALAAVAGKDLGLLEVAKSGPDIQPLML